MSVSRFKHNQSAVRCAYFWSKISVWYFTTLCRNRRRWQLCTCSFTGTTRSLICLRLLARFEKRCVRRATLHLPVLVCVFRFCRLRHSSASFTGVACSSKMWGTMNALISCQCVKSFSRLWQLSSLSIHPFQRHILDPVSITDTLPSTSELSSACSFSCSDHVKIYIIDPVSVWLFWLQVALMTLPWCSFLRILCWNPEHE